MSIIDGFLLHAKHQPTAPAICAPGWNYNIVSYGRLLSFADKVAAHALTAGLKRGDIVVIFAKDPIFHWALILGLARIGVVSLSIVNANLPAGFRIEAVLTDTPARFQNAGRVIQVDASWVEGDGKPPAAEVETDGSATARIILTSGTTGDQKAVALVTTLSCGASSPTTSPLGTGLRSARAYSSTSEWRPTAAISG